MAPKKRGIRLVLALAILGVALGVATLNLTQAVLSGLQKVFHQSILGFNAHLVVMKEGEMERPKEEEGRILAILGADTHGATPFLYRESLILAKGRVKGAVLKGIDPLTFSQVYDVKVRPWKATQVPANIENLLKASGEIPSLVLGQDLAEELEISGSGQTVKVFLPKGVPGQTPAGSGFQIFQVTGTFTTGLYEYDHGFAFADITGLQKVFEVPGKATGIEMKLREPMRADAISRRLKQALGYPYEAVSWQKLNAPLFRVLRIERAVFFVIMSMVVLVAAFNVVGVLLLMISEKTREISILKALGGSQRKIGRIFGLQGLAIGALGSLFGIILGAAVAWFLRSTQILKFAKEVYLVEELPVDLSLVVALMVFAAGLGISFLATQLAVRRLKKVPLDL